MARIKGAAQDALTVSAVPHNESGNRTELQFGTGRRRGVRGASGQLLECSKTERARRARIVRRQARGTPIDSPIRGREWQQVTKV